MLGMTEPQCARRRAAAHERESRRQQREWFEAVAASDVRGAAIATRPGAGPSGRNKRNQSSWRSPMNALGRYVGGLYEAWLMSGVWGYLLVGVWLVYPVAVATAFHPADQMLVAGEGWAVLTLAVLTLIQLGLVILIYRSVQYYVRLWPLALFLVGVIANGVWYLRTGCFDPSGALTGLSPVIAAIVCYGVCERLGANFVFGPGPKPEYETAF
jgi:hypothetical protein